MRLVAATLGAQAAAAHLGGAQHQQLMSYRAPLSTRHAYTLVGRETGGAPTQISAASHHRRRAGGEAPVKKAIALAIALAGCATSPAQRPDEPLIEESAAASSPLDLPGTIRATAANAGALDLKMVPERHNRIKVLLLMDVGGSMDDHVQRVQEMFSAAKSEFKHLEFFYFHNCVYEHLWKHNQRRYSEKFSTSDVLHKYNRDYKLIFVGDATMSPFEIVQPGGSVEFNNEEAGAVWLQRLTEAFPHFVWINPEPVELWSYRQSVGLIQRLMNDRMFALTLPGLDAAMRTLNS
jgi:hypothetical protein